MSQTPTDRELRKRLRILLRQIDRTRVKAQARSLLWDLVEAWNDSGRKDWFSAHIPFSAAVAGLSDSRAYEYMNALENWGLLRWVRGTRDSLAASVSLIPIYSGHMPPPLAEAYRAAYGPAYMEEAGAPIPRQPFREQSRNVPADGSNPSRGREVLQREHSKQSKGESAYAREPLQDKEDNRSEGNAFLSKKPKAVDAAKEHPLQVFLAEYGQYRRVPASDAAQAEAAWMTLYQRDALPDLEELLSALCAHGASKQWTRENGRYVPRPVKFLQDELWQPDALPKQPNAAQASAGGGASQPATNPKRDWRNGETSSSLSFR